MITVLSVPYSLAPVAIDAIGGAEVVLAQIDRTLVAQGHRSIVVAPAGSRIAGSLISTGSLPEVLDERAHAIAIASMRRAITDALERFPVDVVHLHGLDFADVMPATEVPTLITLHLPIAMHDGAALGAWAERAQLACVSRSQADDLPPRLRDRVVVVENGVDLARYRPRTGAHAYLLAMGRICPEKNFPAAIEAARRAGRGIVVAGSAHGYESHVRHLREAIASAVGPGVCAPGAIGGARKLRLLSGAHCLLVPSLVRETSSLVAMEALACGTPVIAFRAGALAEVVEHGRTGLVVDDVASMAEAITRVSAIDRRACRQRAEERFDARRSIERWIALLESIGAGGRQHHAA